MFQISSECSILLKDRSAKILTATTLFKKLDKNKVSLQPNKRMNEL